MASLALLLFYAPFHAISEFLAGLLGSLRTAGRLGIRLAPLPATANQLNTRPYLKR